MFQPSEATSREAGTGGFENDPRRALILYHTKGGLLEERYGKLEDLKTPTGEEVKGCVEACLHEIGQETGWCWCAICQSVHRESRFTSLESPGYLGYYYPVPIKSLNTN